MVCPSWTAIVAHTWRYALSKLQVRADALRRQGSPVFRAVLWTTYAASLLLFPAALAAPTEGDAKALNRAYAQVFDTGGWCTPAATTAMFFVF